MKTTPEEVQESVEILGVLNTVLEVVAYATFIPKELILSKIQKREVAVARQIYCYFAKKHTPASLAIIGGLIGKDHATVLHSIKAVNNLIDTKDKYYPWIKRVKGILFNELEDIQDHVGRVQRLLDGLDHLTDDVAFYTMFITVLQKDLEYIKVTKRIKDFDDLEVLGVLDSMKAMIKKDNLYNFNNKEDE